MYFKVKLAFAGFILAMIMAGLFLLNSKETIRFNNFYFCEIKKQDDTITSQTSLQKFVFGQKDQAFPVGVVGLANLKDINIKPDQNNGFYENKLPRTIFLNNGGGVVYLDLRQKVHSNFEMAGGMFVVNVGSDIKVGNISLGMTTQNVYYEMPVNLSRGSESRPTAVIIKGKVKSCDVGQTRALLKNKA